LVKTIVLFVDSKEMKKILFLLIFNTIVSNAQSPFEAKSRAENKEASQNPKIKCRWICDKKLYTEQKIAEAVYFYKHSKYYNFKSLPQKNNMTK